MVLGSLGKKHKQNNSSRHQTVEAHELISYAEVEQIRKALINSHAELVVQGMLDADVREQLESIVRREFKHVTRGNDDVIAYVVRETIGTGVVEEILQDTSITDVGYNGSELIVESNDSKITYNTNFEITDDYIIRLVNKFANANNKEFTAKNPIFDGRFQHVRINAVHGQNTAPESGTTMALRVVRPRLALTEHNFDGFAPMFILDFFKAAVLAKANMVISGTTGTGKTELHKLISSNITFDDRILLIEDTPETFMKEMFPDKDIYSWVTSDRINVTTMIKAGLRNHPTWIMVTETRGSEAYEMIQAVLSGHSIITSLHATNARAIPARLVNMAKMGYTFSEEALIDDIRRYFHFGIHIKKVKYKGMVIRYLSEIIEFNPDGDTTVFKQRFVDGVFYFETFDVSQDFRDVLEEAMVTLDFPSHFKSERQLNPHTVPFQASIPIAKDGRPDFRKIKEMGTTLTALMQKHRRDDAENEVSDTPVVSQQMSSGAVPSQARPAVSRAVSSVASSKVVSAAFTEDEVAVSAPRLTDDELARIQSLKKQTRPVENTARTTRVVRQERSAKDILDAKRNDLRKDVPKHRSDGKP